MHTLYQMAKPEFEPTENFKCSAKTIILWDLGNSNKFIDF